MTCLVQFKNAVAQAQAQTQRERERGTRQKTEKKGYEHVESDTGDSGKWLWQLSGTQNIDREIQY